MRLMFTILLTVVVLFGCSQRETAESKNIEQIYKEEGIPIKTKTLFEAEFTKELSYNTVLSGLRQSAASAMIGGRIEKVLVKVGDFVEKDQVLFEFPEDAPAGQFKQANAGYELAKSTFERLQNLYELGGISKQDLDGAETQFKVAEANLDGVLQMLKVRAPISGHVTNITVRETDGVQAESVLATISQTEKLKAKIWATEEEAEQLRAGKTATANHNGKTIFGKVTQVGIASDMKHNAFAVDLVFDNNGFKSGVMSEIKINTYKNFNALSVNRKNVKSDSKGKFVFISDNNIAKKVYVTVGKENRQFEILSGLKAGDKVITEGLNLIYDGAKIKEVK